MTILISFFFSISVKRKLDFINFHFGFSISILFPAFLPIFPAFPPWFSAFPPIFPSFPPWFSASHPITCILHVPTQDPHIFTPFPAFPPWFPAFSLLFPTFSPQFPHSLHSVPRFPIPAFTDSQIFRILFLVSLKSVNIGAT